MVKSNMSVINHRVTESCNAWFFCEDSLCTDWQTGASVTKSHCILMKAAPEPQPEPRLQDVTTPDDFFSYQAGYMKGGPPPLCPRLETLTGPEGRLVECS